MAARAYWQGQIRLALVSIPVEVYTATKSGAKIQFHQIHEPSGKRINYEKVVQGIGPVDRDEIVKGYEISKGNYVLLDDDEIEAAKVESRRTLDLVQFVDAGEIDVFYFDNPYYVVPADELAEEAFVVLREALRETRKIGLGQLSVRGREYLVSLKPCGKGLVLETLRYEDEVRKAQGYFKEIPDKKPDKGMVDLAKTLIEQKAAPFDAGEFHDRYVEALEELIKKKAKAKGKKILEDVEEPETAHGSNVIDLMAALKKSVGGKGEAPAKKPGAKKAAAKKAPAKKAEPMARKRA
jgi:DNA end-binding protein Ku